MNFNCEQRATAKMQLIFCVCSGQKSDASFAAFKNAQKKLYHLMIKSQNADSAEL